MADIPPPQAQLQNQYVKPVQNHPLDNYNDNDYPVQTNQPLESVPINQNQYGAQRIPQNYQSGYYNPGMQMNPNVPYQNPQPQMQIGPGSVGVGNQQPMGTTNINFNGTINANQNCNNNNCNNQNNCNNKNSGNNVVNNGTNNGLINNGHLTVIIPQPQPPLIIETREVIKEGKGMNCGLAIAILFLNICWPGVGTIICAFYFNNGTLKEHYLKAGLAQIFMAFIIIGWCYGFMTSFFLLSMACHDVDAYVYYQNNHSKNCAY